jgi:hypothetical protein
MVWMEKSPIDVSTSWGLPSRLISAAHRFRRRSPRRAAQANRKTDPDHEASNDSSFAGSATRLQKPRTIDRS